MGEYMGSAVIIALKSKIFLSYTFFWQILDLDFS